MIVLLRGALALVTVVSVLQCGVRSAVRPKRDLEFIGNNMKEALETGGTIANVAQGVIGKIYGKQTYIVGNLIFFFFCGATVSKGAEIIDKFMGMAGQGDSDSSEEEKRRKKRNAKPCGKGGGSRMYTTEPATDEKRRRREAIETAESTRTRRDVIDSDNAMPDARTPDVGNVFKRVIEAAQNAIEKIRTMFAQSSGNPNANIEYLDEDAEMI